MWLTKPKIGKPLEVAIIIYNNFLMQANVNYNNEKRQYLVLFVFAPPTVCIRMKLAARLSKIYAEELRMTSLIIFKYFQ